MKDVFTVSESSDRQQRSLQVIRGTDFHAALDPDDTIVPPFLEDLT